MLRKKIFPAALLTLAVLLTAASSVTSQQGEMLREEFHQTYPLASGGRIGLGNINGSVRVTAWDRDEVKVDAVKMAYRRDRLDEAKIEVRADQNSIHLQTTYPERSQTFTDGEGRYNNPATVQYTLMVPRTARINSIELINGDLDIEGMSGDVKASSINGRVAANGLTGPTRLSTINGKLIATFNSLNQSNAISLGSVNGPISLIIPSDSNAELRANTVHGSIKNDFGLPVHHGEYVGRDLAGRLGQGGVRIKLGNVNGTIAIQRASDGRPLSPVTNLLSETVEDTDEDDDDDSDTDSDRAETRRVARQAAREATRAQTEARRAQVEARRATIDAGRARQQAQMEAVRARSEATRAQAVAKSDAARAAQQEAAQARVEALRVQREAMVEAQRAQAESQRVAREAQRVAQREAAQVQAEAQRAVRDAARAARAASAVRVEGESYNSLRLVERETKSFKVSGTPNVNLQTFDGYITVRGWDKQEVFLTVSKRAATDQQLRGIRVRTEQNNSSIAVMSEFDKSFATQVGGGVSVTNALVNLDVYVPRNATVKLTSGDGRLEIEGINGTLELNTGDGRIEVRDARGRLTAKTGDGRIQVDNFDGAVDARTGDGRIQLDGRFNQLAARTGSGAIVLTLPSDINATIETDSEAVDNEGLNLTEETGGAGRRLRRWKVNRGGNVLTLRAGEGRIILRSSGQ